MTLTPFVPWPAGETLLLASRSPRRAELLRVAGVPFEVRPAAEHVEDPVVAARLAQGPTFGYAQTKRAIQAAANQSLDTHLDLEEQLMKACGESADYAEGVAAFLDKRPAEFTGR